MNILKRYPLVCAVLIFIFCLFGGAVIGWAYAQYVIQGIAEAVRQSRTDDPLDGLWLVSIGIIFKGLVTGTIIGIILGIAAYKIGRKRKKLH